MKAAAGASYIPVTAILSTKIHPELKLLKFCSFKQTKISFDDLKTLFDVSHLGNDVNFSVEISYPGIII